jgi:hypothetical protein
VTNVIQRRSELRGVAVGAVVGAVAAGGLGWAVHHWIVAHEGANTGPTLATLDEAFGTYYAIASGLLVAVFCAFLLARRVSLTLGLGASIGAATLLVVVLAAVGSPDAVVAGAVIFAGCLTGLLGTGVASMRSAFVGGPGR